MERLELENKELKQENARLTLSNQKQFSDTMEARKALTSNQLSMNEIINKLQMDYEDLSIEYQKSNTTDQVHKQ